MYNQFLISKPSKISGSGTFTDINIPPNKPIIEIIGDIFLSENIKNKDPGDYLQVSNKFFIGPSGSSYDFINHSCDPNCYFAIVGKRAILYSLYLIKEGTELTIDYSINSTDDLENWKMSCSCNSYKCRKIISGFKYLDASLKEEYIRKGLVSMFITSPSYKG